MSSQVFFGSPRQARLEANETLPAKLDLILERLNVRDRVKGETVAIKMHTGNNIGLFDGPSGVCAQGGAGGKGWRRQAVHLRCGLGCDKALKSAAIRRKRWAARSIRPPGRMTNTFTPHERPYKNIKTWKVAGMIQDATFLINFAHVKGHPSCGFGGAFKNLALGCMIGRDAQRHARHHALRPLLVCREMPGRGNAQDVSRRSVRTTRSSRTRTIRRNCTCTSNSATSAGAALQVAPPGSLKIDPVNFHAFQEACAISASISLVDL